MATASRELIKRKVLWVWDWPIVPGSGYRAKDRERFDSLSGYLSSVGAIGSGTAAALTDASVWTTLCVSTLGLAAGHYLAGLITEMRRSRR